LVWSRGGNGEGRRPFAALALALAMLAPSAAAADAVAGSASMRLGAIVAPPDGYLEFCLRSPQACNVTPGAVGGAMARVRADKAAALAAALQARFLARPAATSAAFPSLDEADIAVAGASAPAVSPRLWSQLNAVNRRINGALKPAEDGTGRGAADHWSLPLMGGAARGDCEDYVLEKRRALIAAGVPDAALSIAVVRTETGVGHAVLLVDTRQGSLVLDNLTTEIRHWRRTSYQWVMRQAPSRPLEWRTVADRTSRAG
jgi:predicted transglutaminase-like cysteine proteinase